MKAQIGIIVFMLWGIQQNVSAASNDSLKKVTLSRLFSYASTVKCDSNVVTYSYKKSYLSIGKRNLLMMGVPTMYAISRTGEREFVNENFSRVEFYNKQSYRQETMVSLSTVPHHHSTMSVLFNYLEPEVYQPTMIRHDILSPFNSENRRFYRYRVLKLMDDNVEITIKPKLNNTQLLSGKAIVDGQTGRLLVARLHGEYDMTKFQLNIDMSDDPGRTLLAKKVELDARFKLLGNKLVAHYSALYNVPCEIADSIRNSEDPSLMEKVRPLELSLQEQNTYNRYFEGRHRSDSIQTMLPPKKETFAKRVLWDMIGENMLTRVSRRYGHNKQGYFRIYPIFNPLYMGYSPSKGYYYKFDMRNSYDFNENVKFSLRLKAGYIFKRHQLYFNIPATLQFNEKHHGYIQLMVGNGNRITNSEVAKAIEETSKDSIDWTKMEMDYFKDFYQKVNLHYDIASHWGFEAGIINHKRTAINKQAFREAGRPVRYSTLAPTLTLIWRPWGWSGPIVASNYERSFKGALNANIDYEKWEFDAQYIHRMKRMQALQLRVGSGFYTRKSNHWYFLDYSNFRRNYLPDGWNDDWSGEFELLNEHWYNVSDYYVRGNLSYETPFLFSAWLPIVGHFIEKERIYVSALSVRRLHPYTEWGYGFTTRLFSMAAFVAFNNRHYEGFGAKFGLELFRGW